MACNDQQLRSRIAGNSDFRESSGQAGAKRTAGYNEAYRTRTQHAGGYRTSFYPWIVSWWALAVTCAFAAAFPLSAQSDPSSSIPKDAVIIERTRVPDTVHPNRELLLWMISPVKHDRGFSENPYTCPEVTLGSYYSGRTTRISLLDTRSGRLINTHQVEELRFGQRGHEFYIPYRILSGSYYSVPGVPKEREGKTALLKLRDLNGDGIAAETAFFEAMSCMGLPTTLIGYSVVQDKVIQYRAEIEVTAIEEKMRVTKPPLRRRRGKPKMETQAWTDYLFSEKPVQPGHWKYEIDYRGRLGCDESYDVRYDPRRETFVGTLRELCPAPDHELPINSVRIVVAAICFSNVADRLHSR